MTSDVDSVQERVLAEILARNAGSEYLQSCGLDDGLVDRAIFRARHSPGIDKGKGLYFLFVKPETKTPGGLTAWSVRPASTRTNFKNFSRNHTSPRAALLCADTFQSMYAHTLCGLCQRHDVLRVGAVFASTLLRAIRFLQLNWEQLAADIEAGGLTSRVNDASVQGRRSPASCTDRIPSSPSSSGKAAARANGPGSSRAFGRTRDTSTPSSPARWRSTSRPSTTTAAGCRLCAVCTGPRNATLASTFARCATRPTCPTPSCPTWPANSSPCTRPPAAASRWSSPAWRPGSTVVVTTYAGLNRYRVGDVLRVAGFHNAAQFQFVRRNVLLSVETDKTDEVELQCAVGRASGCSACTASVAEYTSRACTGASRGTTSSTGAAGAGDAAVDKRPSTSAAWRWRRL
ncbi:hypothetical protein ZWY2020_047360 [Hordeum vulgare]|nr:hypothetical protein ZWY2020_047360 [Hordeum vulgare]